MPQYASTINMGKKRKQNAKNNMRERPIDKNSKRNDYWDLQTLPQEP